MSARGGAGSGSTAGPNYRLERLTSFLQPIEKCDLSGPCYQIIQARSAIFEGGWFGVGLGKGALKWDWLPEADNDFIYAVVSEELGVVGCVLVLLLFGVLAYTGFHYANLGRTIGLRGYYTVQMDLSNAGGIFPNGDVTYRGVSVGRVGGLQLTPSGVVADLNISSSAPPIPSHLHAVVADLSAVGEQYVDLRPLSNQGPYLAQGSVIPRQATTIPLPVTSLLNSVNTLATSLPLANLAIRTSSSLLGIPVGCAARLLHVTLDL